MSDLAKNLAEKQKEMPKLIAPLNKKRPARLNDQDSDSEPESISVARTSTPVKSNTAVPKTTPVNSRNNLKTTPNLGKNQNRCKFSENVCDLIFIIIS